MQSTVDDSARRRLSMNYIGEWSNEESPVRRPPGVAISAATVLAGGLATSVAGAGARPTAATAASGKLTVLAAASLSKVFPKIASEKYTFAGSGMLETEIKQGARADVFAAASPKQPAELFTARLVYKPVVFASNTLVMIVPKDNPTHIRSVGDITKKGVKIVVCNATVPCGAYASTASPTSGSRRRRRRTSSPS